MKSFDLFDTLVAARQGKAGEAPVEHTYPVLENLLKIRPEDTIISDYDRPAKAEQIVRSVLHLQNKLIVTPLGKWDGSLWPTLNPKPESHFGDNDVADFQRPAAAGIPATLYPGTQWLESFKMNGLQLACREARLSTWDPQFRSLQLLQIEANFPLLVHASLALDDFTRKRGIKRLLMSARDCNLWVHLQEDIKKRLGSQYEIEYWPSSRICRNKPSPFYLQEFNKRLDHACLVDVGGTGKSLAKLVSLSERPETPSFTITQYNWTDFDGYPQIDLSNIHPLVKIPQCTIEYSNFAQHPMYVDWDKTEGDWDWKRREIVVMHEAFEAARAALQHYDLPTYSREELIRCFSNLNNYDLSFLRASGPIDDAVIAKYDKDYGRKK